MSSTPHVVVDEPDTCQADALRIAQRMIAAGIPIFAAPPCPAADGGVCERPGHAGGREEYDLPSKWQLTVPSEVWLERWRPGWALAAVGGHAADFLDEDPRSGGDASLVALDTAGHTPRVYGVARTPSGGRHLTIAPLGEHKATPATPDLPGLDYQGGGADGGGRGFVWIAPTLKRSKAMDDLGRRKPYVWEQEPDLDWLTEGGDESGDMLRTRIAGARGAKRERGPDDRTPRLFTEAEAKRFVQPQLDRLMRAQVGGIEEAANTLATTLSHFVPSIWDAGFAFDVLSAALTETAYDPAHPASGWHADKFRAVIAGEAGRAPQDWKAEPKPEIGAPAPEPQGDEVDALLAEMVTPEELMARPPRPYLIKGVLHLASVAWLIGEPGSRKSFVALDMAAHVSLGRDWQGMKVHRGPVLIIAAEGASGIGGRFTAWQLEHGPRTGGEPIHVLPRPVQAGRPDKWQVLVRAAERLKPVLVLLDTQARVTVGLKENDATDMGIFIEAAGALMAATGACVIPIHHTGRKGGDARGSSALDGAQDTELKVVAGAEPLRGELRMEKQKDMIEGPPLPLTFAVHTVGVDEDGEDVTSLALRTPSAWREAAHGQQPEAPEAWETGHARVIVEVFKVLRDQGGEIGITKAEARLAVIERFYGGQPARLNKSTWYSGWRRALERRSASGDPVVCRAGGARFTVDELALGDMDKGDE